MNSLKLISIFRLNMININHTKQYFGILLKLFSVLILFMAILVIINTPAYAQCNSNFESYCTAIGCGCESGGMGDYCSPCGGGGCTYDSICSGTDVCCQGAFVVVVQRKKNHYC